MRHHEKEWHVARILVSGATGLVGTATVAALRQRGDTVLTLVRRSHALGGTDFYWDPETFVFPEGLMSEVDAVIHLAGEPIAQRRWTTAQKSRIWESRIRSTRLLVAHFLKAEKRPKRMLCASAIGYYGASCGLVDETGTPGTDFLATLCQAWEHETAVLSLEEISVANMRFGMLLSPSGGALAKLLPSFRLGLGGVLGRGDQSVSWLGLPDAVAAMLFLLDRPDIEGPVNMTSPTPLTQRVFAETVSEVVYGLRTKYGPPYWRGVPFSVPEWALRLGLGEMTDALLLSHQSVLPRCLETAGFAWQYGHLEGLLRELLA